MLDRMRALEARQEAITKELSGLLPLPRLEPVVITDRLDEWRRLLRSSTTQARSVIQRVLKGRLTFIPKLDGDQEGYEFYGPTRFDKLFTGIALPVPRYIKIGDSRGKEHITREMTGEADYERLLENAANGKGMVSLSTPSWNQLHKWLSDLASIEPIVHAGRSEAQNSP